ncbi:enoyl-CoA hydratase/isomerase family protein [Candidatus Rickettsia barbariae]
MALGSGYELLLHSSFIIIGNQELNAGFVERGVGLIPGWGGVTEMFA